MPRDNYEDPPEPPPPPRKIRPPKRPPKGARQEETEYENVIEPPPGFQKPSGAGNEFELVCTFRQEPDGTLCLTQLGDYKMEDEEGEEKREGPPDYKDMAGEMRATPITGMMGGEQGMEAAGAGPT